MNPTYLFMLDAQIDTFRTYLRPASSTLKLKWKQVRKMNIYVYQK